MLHEYKACGLPTLAKLCPPNKTNWVSVSGLCHIVLFYGLGPTDLPFFPTGKDALKTLTDEATAIKAFGQSPFVRTRNGIRYYLANDPVFHVPVGEAHRDQCLATFAELDLPLDTPVVLKTGRYSIRDILTEAIANFDLHEKELAWTAIALAKYLPPKKAWADRFGERTTFSHLVRHLFRVDMNQQSCAGTHIFEALAKIDKADRDGPFLDKKTRRQLDSWLKATVQELVERQQFDGNWTKQWCSSMHPQDTRNTTFETSFLTSGHLIEVLRSLGANLCPPAAVFTRADKWVLKALTSQEISPDGHWLCPYAHGARAVREDSVPSQTRRSDWTNEAQAINYEFPISNETFPPHGVVGRIALERGRNQ